MGRKHCRNLSYNAQQFRHHKALMRNTAAGLFRVNESCAAAHAAGTLALSSTQENLGRTGRGRNFGVATVVARQTFGCLPLRSNTASAAPSRIRRRSPIRGYMALRQFMPPRRMAVISPSDNLVGRCRDRTPDPSPINQHHGVERRTPARVSMPRPRRGAAGSALLLATATCPVGRDRSRPFRPF
jgi:hypothetical protein